MYDSSAPNFLSILMLRRKRSFLLVAAFSTRPCELIIDASDDDSAEAPITVIRKTTLLEMRTIVARQVKKCYRVKERNFVLGKNRLPCDRDAIQCSSRINIYLAEEHEEIVDAPIGKQARR